MHSALCRPLLTADAVDLPLLEHKSALYPACCLPAHCHSSKTALKAWLLEESAMQDVNRRCCLCARPQLSTTGTEAVSCTLVASPPPAQRAAQSSAAAAAAHLGLPDLSLHPLLAPGSAWLLESIIYKAAGQVSVDMDVSTSSRPKVKLPQGPIWQTQDGHVVAHLQCMQPSDMYHAQSGGRDGARCISMQRERPAAGHRSPLHPRRRASQMQREALQTPGRHAAPPRFQSLGLQPERLMTLPTPWLAGSAEGNCSTCAAGLGP